MQPRNPWLCLAIVCFLGAFGLAGTVGIILAMILRVPVDASLSTFVGACIGSLASFLVSVPRGSAGGDGNSDHSVTGENHASPTNAGT